MRTSLDAEREEQSRWKLLPQWANLSWFDSLIANEFCAPHEQRAQEQQALSTMVRFASTQVPYYREQFDQLGLVAGDVQTREDLVRLPQVTKKTIRSQGANMCPQVLPRGEVYAGSKSSSGTTGQPTTIHQTERTRLMELLLTQRQMRWYRFDPSKSFAWIRIAEDIRVPPDGCPLAEGKTHRCASWPGVGRYFKTGPFLGYAKSNSMEHKVEWLENHRPSYLLAGSSLLEHLALAFQGRSEFDSLRGLRAISEPLTAGMRQRIEKTFNAPVHISYGTNELGWVATACKEGNRYHVHTEHCLVEIVDEAGTPCVSGAYGRILLTMLGNTAMPLIRFDTGDFAQAIAGDCPCGRTLPSFGAVVGRHSHIAALPAGTWDQVNALRDGLERLPRELSANLREYQLHHYRNGDIELRVVVVRPLPPGFSDHMYGIFENSLQANSGALHITEIDNIPLAPSGKFFHLTSDFYPEAKHGAGS